MISPDAFKNAEAYTQQQDRLLRVMADDQLKAFVIPSIDAFTDQHFQPIAHGVCQTLEPTTSPWIEGFLYNGGEGTRVSPPLRGTLPARFSDSIDDYQTDRIFLSMDRGLLKIKTRAPSEDPRHSVMMTVATYDIANREEAADYRAKRANLGDIIDPEATIIKPRRAISYDRRAHHQTGFACRYWNWDDHTKHVSFYDSSDAPPPPDRFRALHQAFMRESRVALAGLMSIYKSS